MSLGNHVDVGTRVEQLGDKSQIAVIAQLQNWTLETDRPILNSWNTFGSAPAASCTHDVGVEITSGSPYFITCPNTVLLFRPLD